MINSHSAHYKQAGKTQKKQEKQLTQQTYGTSGFQQQGQSFIRDNAQNKTQTSRHHYKMGIFRRNGLFANYQYPALDGISSTHRSNSNENPLHG